MIKQKMYIVCCKKVQGVPYHRFRFEKHLWFVYYKSTNMNDNLPIVLHPTRRGIHKDRV